VVGRVEKGALLIDLRCVPEDSDADVIAAVKAAQVL
jgi:L-seryl-tRNA(Ser) seleniumtransferase